MVNPLRLASRSLAGKFLILAGIFMTVPVILYGQFEAADAERQAFLLRSLQVQGRLAAQGLEPVLNRVGGRAPLDAAKALAGLATEQVHIKLLLRPAGRADAFFLVATSPPLDAGMLDGERQHLDETGVLSHLDESCAGDHPLAIRYAAQGGREELLTSLSPVHATAGCWVILSSYATDDLAGSSLARPFSNAPEVRLAMAFYGLMAVLIAMAVIGTLVDLRAFGRLAKGIRQDGSASDKSFAAVTAVPELLPVAREFDRMVATLDASARALREAAEDNAHAFKAPLAAITQSLEPLRHGAAAEPRAAGALDIIEKALGRLGNLINAARRLDESAADLIKAKLRRLDVAALAQQMAEAYDRIHAPQNLRITARTSGPCAVAATEDSLETVIENLLDNALSFSPAGGTVRIGVRAIGRTVQLAVEDDGPGVPPAQLAGIFRRNVSLRPRHGDNDDGTNHFGIGLAVVRRTAELLGGSVTAENLPGAGLRVTVSLPAA